MELKNVLTLMKKNVRPENVFGIQMKTLASRPAIFPRNIQATVHFHYNNRIWLIRKNGLLGPELGSGWDFFAVGNLG